MSYTGIAERILHIANVLVGKMRGGLGVANILVSTMMGGVSASNLADAAMLSRMMVPEMERKGYNRAFAAAITAGGSLVTPIIPPGIALIIYGLVADVTIGKMFIAGLVPGLLCAVVLMFTVYLVARKTNAKPSRESWPTGKRWCSRWDRPGLRCSSFLLWWVVFALTFSPQQKQVQQRC